MDRGLLTSHTMRVRRLCYQLFLQESMSDSKPDVPAMGKRELWFVDRIGRTELKLRCVVALLTTAPQR